ncbi:unnamed protein product [Cuscuta epithymum]|uniref:Uncharacterized protein n=1 Tax=Cuscuta epithymum TaxID=186058 RepID=A0AAV0DR99_9ASTE|nr:unnamed protein product [Cuscuta epithymum]
MRLMLRQLKSTLDVNFKRSFRCRISMISHLIYQNGMIYGIDAASGAAVLALDISSGDHVLALIFVLHCCSWSHGAKLCMILDSLGSSGSMLYISAIPVV